MSSDGALGFDSPGKGQQTGSIAWAVCPHEDGFVQCDSCKLPRQYPYDRATLRSFRVNARGVHSCARCRRHRWAEAGPWYTPELRVFRGNDDPKGLPVLRVVPMRAFKEAQARYPGAARLQYANLFLLGWAAQVLGDSHCVPTGSNARFDAWAAGRVSAQLAGRVIRGG